MPETTASRARARAATAAALALAALLGLWAFAGREATGPAEDWATVHREDLVVGVEVSGTLAAVESAVLGPPQVPDMWDFKVSFMAPEGAAVRQGQPVLGFDSSELRTKLQEKIAERDAAEKELEKRQANRDKSRGDDEMSLAEARAKRRKALLKANVPSDLVAANSLQESRADLALADREIAYYERRLALQESQAGSEIGALRDKRDRAAARVRETEAAIRQMTVLAPRDGTVVYAYDPRREREKKKIGDSCWRGERVMEIPDLRRLAADGQVDEADAGRVAVGQRVTLRLDAHPDVVYSGRVSSLRGAVETRSQTERAKVVGLQVALDRTDPQRMRPGMRFFGTIEIERVPGVLVIPADAVFNHPEGPTVYRRARWGSEVARPRLGRRNARWVEVLGGLADGDAVSRRDLAVEAGGGR